MTPNDQLKRLIQTIWGKVASKGKKKGQTDDPNQMKLALGLPSTPFEPKVTKPLKHIQPTIPGLTPKERRKKYLSDFSQPPFYTNTSKWLADNFRSDYYIGPDLTKYGFHLGGSQKIKAWEKIKYPYQFVTNMEDYMQSWNYALARKLKVVDVGIEKGIQK